MSISIRIVYTRLRPVNITAEAIRNMDAFTEIDASGDNPGDKVTAWLKKRGFKTEKKENRVISIKGRLSFLPGTVMRTGLIILMISFIFSVYLRKTEEKILSEGGEGQLLGKKIYLAGIKSNLPEEFLQLGEKSSFRLSNISAMLSSSQNTYMVTGRFPAKINGLYYRITHLGFYQPLSLKASSTVITKNAELDILPPGKTDIVAFPAENMHLTFTLHPEKTIKKGLLTGKVFNLKTLSYSVILQKGKNKHKSENIILKPEETASSEGIKISLGKSFLFIKIQSVYDPALLWIYTAILITMAGLVLMFSRFFWYKKQICAIFINDKVLLGYTEEFYKKWGIMKFYSWIEETRPD